MCPLWRGHIQWTSRMSCMVCMVWLVGLALNLSKYWSNFPPSVISDSNMASRLGAGDAGVCFFVWNLSECRGRTSCVREISGCLEWFELWWLRDYDGSAPNLSECCVPFLPSVDIERGFRRKSGAGDAGGGFLSCEISRNARMESLRSRDFLLWFIAWIL